MVNLARFNHGGFLFDKDGEALVAKLRALVVPHGPEQATGGSSRTWGCRPGHGPGWRRAEIFSRRREGGPVPGLRAGAAPDAGRAR